MSPLLELRTSLVALSRRCSRVAYEVEDLAHDIILSALRRGSTLDDDTFLRSSQGAARRHAAFLARSALRRRAREAASADQHAPDAEPDAEPDSEADGAPLSVLPPSLRTTLFLLLLGLEKAELRLVLGVSDTALRKRFQALREHAPLTRPKLRIPNRTAALAQLRRSQVGLLPRLAVAQVDRSPGQRVLAVSDPDGFGVIFAEVLTREAGSATPHAPATNARTRRRET